MPPRVWEIAQDRMKFHEVRCLSKLVQRLVIADKNQLRHQLELPL
jgi:hypothetical protein